MTAKLITILISQCIFCYISLKRTVTEIIKLTDINEQMFCTKLLHEEIIPRKVAKLHLFRYASKASMHHGSQM
jgi:hypothetical protein